MTGDIYWIWFQLVFGIGTRRAEIMMNHFENPQVIYMSIQDKAPVSEMLTKNEKYNCRNAMARAE